MTFLLQNTLLFIKEEPIASSKNGKMVMKKRQLFNLVNIYVFQLPFPVSRWGVGAAYLTEIKGRNSPNLGHNTIHMPQMPKDERNSAPGGPGMVTRAASGTRCR